MNDYLFGPLGRNYCLYFYIFSVFGFFMMLLIIGTAVLGLIASGKKLDFKYVWAGFIAILTWFLMYFQNRMLYNMCKSSE